MAQIYEDQDQPAEFIAALLGLTRRRVRQLVHEGMPKNGRNRYPVFACNRWYIDHISKPELPSDSINKTKKRLLTAQAQKAEIEVKEKRGQLVPIVEIREQANRNAAAIRNRFLAMPDRLAQMLETTSTYAERRQMIDAEIKTALEALANDAIDD